ncbi:metallophosphoesterase [Bradyrhizobium sp. sGM-13]|uniref:metallophosphoesterase family protein n=1 Tax=Bradyrhizobium sp. sGM-13 TaxID=2831781 RepID=UPI001BCD13F5|nr:metallophosphoesterase [Bradyrhizobium sp. sGM-13]
MFTLLHISDLHRSPEEPVDNTALVAALVNDHDRYIGETPAVPPPDAIIVSGDLMQGARLGQSDWEKVVREQYLVAEDFLDQLTKRFLNGDRSKMVIIPGNHDVCWNTALSSMEVVPDGDPARQNVYATINEPGSGYRWSWKDLQLYRIANPNRYAARLDAYWEFTERFYAGTSVRIDRHRGYQFFDLDDGRVVVAAFDSTHGNDCFSYSGSFRPGVVGRCYLDLRDRERQSMLKVALWHHSVQGPPTRVDYLDINEVYQLAGHGFQLGMHGHQHVAAAAAYYVHRERSQEMAVVSAGSLCAGFRELPRGVNRQYNLIVINDDYSGARVHVREMIEGGHFTRASGQGFLQGYTEIGWQIPLDAAGRQVNVAQQNERRAIEQAERALGSRDWKAALDYIRSIPAPIGSYARKIATEAALRCEDWTFLKALFADSHSTSETTTLIAALTNLGDLDGAEEVLTALRVSRSQYGVALRSESLCCDS